jgi:hypothetical protein
MKHLRSFNEGVNHEDIKDFCEMSLAYLLDEGVSVKVDNYNRNEEVVTITLHEKLTWTECKDHIIPLLTRVANKYELGEFGSYRNMSSNNRNFNLCVKGTHGIRVDVMIGINEIKDIEQIMNKQWNGELIMDQIIFYVKGEK